MRDKKDIATIDLPGFEAAELPDAPLPAPEARRASNRPRAAAPEQEQLTLLDLNGVDVTGLPVWQRDPNLDVTGLPVWQPSP